MDDKKEKNENENEEFFSASGRGGGKEESNSTIDKFKQPSSKFKNRLQAARDEHHFMADDYLS
jgi:hypothetical protein